MTSTASVARVEEKASKDSVNRVGLELERRDNAEVPTAATKSPEEILVVKETCGQHSTVGGDNSGRKPDCRWTCRTCEAASRHHRPG